MTLEMDIFENIKTVVEKNFSNKHYLPLIYGQEKENIKIQTKEPTVLVEAEEPNLTKIKDKICNLHTTNKDWLLLLTDTKQHKKSAIGFNDNSNELVHLLERIEGINSFFRFNKFSPFDTELSLNVLEREIVIKSNAERYCVIKHMDDVVNFNIHQAQLLNEMEVLKNKIVDVAKIYDEDAFFDYQQSSLRLFKQPFPLIMKKIASGWKICFYKTYKPEQVIMTQALSNEERSILELADKFAREEQFFDLFRD